MSATPLHQLQSSLASLLVIPAQAQQKFLERSQGKIFALLHNIDYFVAGYELGSMLVATDKKEEISTDNNSTIAQSAQDDLEQLTNDSIISLPHEDAFGNHPTTPTQVPTSEFLGTESGDHKTLAQQKYNTQHTTWHVPKSTLKRRMDLRSTSGVKCFNSFAPLQTLSQRSDDSVYRFSDSGLCDEVFQDSKVYEFYEQYKPPQVDGVEFQQQDKIVTRLQSMEY
eukprot:TRINITY_DN1176_c0_g1_i7.p1 TRINITY_DN1176_c0_g1~~TRINITY_DN1176_c0_g1_i7.p1  ORF type:complete len:254 (-),score=1.69 TRINITY_DN1176_c0_g1_i7:44-718(-)